jgi:hypothetical protein
MKIKQRQLECDDVKWTELTQDMCSVSISDEFRV